MKIAICTPMYSAPTWGYTNSLADLLIASRGIELQYCSIRGSMPALQRNEIARVALGAGVDRVLWIDADHTFPADGLYRLLKHGQHFVGCNYPKRKEPHGPTAGRIGAGGKVEPVGTAGAGLEAVDLLGMGFCLVSRQVFEKVPEPWFDGPDEDYGFCAKARLVGFKVMLDHDLSKEIGHITETVLKL